MATPQPRTLSVICPRTARRGLTAWLRCRVQQITVVAAVICASTLAFAERLPLKFYTTADGLPHNAINKIVRDSRGFLWFCTAEGLSRFEGYTFTNFGADQGLPQGSVADLLEDRDGRYWVATSGGLFRFDADSAALSFPPSDSQRRVKRWSFFNIIDSEDQDPRARSVNVLRQDKSGTIWCGTDKGLFRLDESGDKAILRGVDVGIPLQNPDHAAVMDLLEDGDGSLWIATFGGLYRRSRDGRSIRATRADGLPDDVIHTLMRDHLGRLWAATRRAGFFQFAPGDAHRPVTVLRSYSLRDVIPTSWVFQLFETSDHRFWVASNLGLLEFFPASATGAASFRPYTTANGLSYREITTLNEDASGNLWIGTNTSGLMKLARNGFVSYGEGDGVASVNSVFEDREGVLCVKGAVIGKGTVRMKNPYRFFGRMDRRHFRGFDPAALAGAQGWVLENVTLRAHDGEWWLGADTGVFRFPALKNFSAIASASPLARYTARDGLTGGQVFRLFEDSSGNIWVSTIDSDGNGFARWDRTTGKWTNLATVAGLPALTEDLPRSFAEDRQGHTWIGFNGALARYANGHFVWFGGNDGVPPGAVSNMLVDHAGRLWLASARSGLARIDDVKPDHPTFRSYTTADGLSSNRTEVITEDLHGRIYVGTGRALDRLDPKTGRIRHFTTADGLAPGLFRAAYRDRNGALWFGMTGGLSRLVPTPDIAAPSAPILLTAITGGNNQRRVFPFGEGKLVLPELGHNDNRLQVDFVGLDFTPGEVLRYQYKLEGGSWSVPSEQRSISFANLEPGRYKVLVRAVSSDGTASLLPASVAFRILPPVWQRWWFLMLMTASLGALAFMAYRYRMAQVIEIANVRTRIATDLHDDIGSNLTKIAILSEVARQQLGTNGGFSPDDPLSAIAHISRESVASMSDIVWAINPQRDRLLDLVRRMRQHAEQLFATRDVQLVFQAPGEDQDTKLRSDVRRDLFLIFKEAVNNVARHAKCSQVTIDFRIQEDRLSLDVTDDGVGFDSEATSSGNGLANMRRRAQRLGGVCEVSTGPGKNTIVHIAMAVSSPLRPTSTGR